MVDLKTVWLSKRLIVGIKPSLILPSPPNREPWSHHSNNPLFTYVGQRSALKPDSVKQSPYTVPSTILTNHSLTTALSFPMPQNNISHIKVQQICSQLVFGLISCFCFLPKKQEKKKKSNGKNYTNLQCVLDVILWSVLHK